MRCSINKIKGRGGERCIKNRFYTIQMMGVKTRSIIFSGEINFTIFFSFWPAVHNNNNNKYLHSNLITDEENEPSLIDRKKLKYNKKSILEQ